MSESVNYSSDEHAWWTSESGASATHDRVLSTVKYIRTNQTDRKVEGLLFAAMYGGSQIHGFGYGAAVRRPLATASRLSLNVCRNMVGAVTSKIAAKNKPKPMFLTEAGNYELRERAQQLEKFVGGVFYESGVYPELTRCFRDACVYGTGVLKISPGDDRVVVERRHPLSIVVDDAEGAEGAPGNIYERRYIDRATLRARWAKGPRADEIRAALAVRRSPDPDDAEYGYQTTADQVLVTEAWHIGYGKESGRHVVCIDGCTLLDEEWDGPFPFAFFRWTEPLEGFFGVGLIEELTGIQREINKLLQQIQRGHHLIAGHWFVHSGSQVVKAHVNNDLGAIVTYAGMAPQYIAPSIISPEVYAHLWQLYAKAFEITGISQLNATGQKPAGLDSGEAQRVYQDIQTERFLEVGQAFEEFVIEAARQTVRCARRIGSSYRVRAFSMQSDAAIISWGDVDIDEELYTIRVYPTSMLPSTPAGKLAWAQDMIKGGVMAPEDVLDILDYPDIDAYKRRKLAPRRIVARNIAAMLRGEYNSPEPFDNHEIAIRLVNEAYHEARLDGVPEARLELLRRYAEDSADQLAATKPQPQPMPPSMPGGSPPMPPPMPPAMPMAA